LPTHLSRGGNKKRRRDKKEEDCKLDRPEAEGLIIFDENNGIGRKTSPGVHEKRRVLGNFISPKAKS